MIVSLTAILFVLSIVSGMLGIGVGMASVPFLSLYLPDLVNGVQPLSLLLNGVTALLSCVAFARAGYVNWRKASILAVTMTLAAPLGSLLARAAPQGLIWTAYLLSVIYVTYSLFRPRRTLNVRKNFRLVLCFSPPIAVLSSFLGVGAGFLLVPALMVCGFDVKKAAGMSSFAVTPASFAAVLPHAAQVNLEYAMVIPLLIAGALGSFIGGWIASRNVPDRHLRYLFGTVIVSTALYRVAQDFI